MAKLQTVKIEKDGVSGECTREALKAWERNGWTAVDDGGSENTEGDGTFVEPHAAAQPTKIPPVDTAPKTDSAKADETKKENG